MSPRSKRLQTQCFGQHHNHSMYARKQKHLSTRYAVHYPLPLPIVPMYVQQAAVYMYPKHSVVSCLSSSSRYISSQTRTCSNDRVHSYMIYANAMQKKGITHHQATCSPFLLPPHSSVPRVTPLRTTPPLTLKLEPLKLVQAGHITFRVDVFVMI